MVCYVQVCYICSTYLDYLSTAYWAIEGDDNELRHFVTASQVRYCNICRLYAANVD